MLRSIRDRGRLIYPLPLVLLLLGGLVACGATGQGSTPGAGTPGGPTLNGCAIQRTPTALPAADVVVTQTGIQGATPTPSQEPATTGFALRRGQVAEIRLSATVMWHATESPDGLLTASQPQDWYDAAGAVCVWRYTAAQPGVVKLSFTGGLVCPPDTACPALAAIAQYEITVR